MTANGVHTVQANGIAHWVRVAGGQYGDTPLVLIHGGPGASAYPWEAIGDQIAQTNPVVFYDQRGCGRTERPDDPATYTVRQLVADLESLRGSLGYDQIMPWGVSFGSVLAAEYTVAHPDRVQRLIMQAPLIVGPLHPGPWALRATAVDTIAGPATRAALRAALARVDDPIQRLWITVETLDADPDAKRRFMFRDPAKAAAAAEASATGPNYGFNEDMARALIGVERAGLLDELAGIDIPALIMIGLWDRNAGVDAARDLAVRLPQAELYVFNHSAHLPHDEEPDEYVATICGFIRR